MYCLIRIFISILFLILGVIFKNIHIYAFVISFIVVGYDVLFDALKNIFKKKILDEHFLMSFASIAAFFLNEYVEAIFVMMLYQLGEYLQDKALSKSDKYFNKAINLKENKVKVEKGLNNILVMDPNLVNISDVILVYPGESILLDGIILKGTTTLDKKFITGESTPCLAKENDEVISGTINISSLIKIKVTKRYTESFATKIQELVKDAYLNKSSKEKFITKFCKIYTPIVVLLAILLALVPSIYLGFNKYFSIWLYRSLSFLIISCPCALIISIPLSFYCAIGKCASKNIVIKKSESIEDLLKTKYVFLDKTGTITKGNFIITEINPTNCSKDELLFYASLLESNSNHPIAKALSKKNYSNLNINTKEIIGMGIEGDYNGNKILCGNASLMNKYNIKFKKPNNSNSIIYVALNKTYLGSIVISDTIKETSITAIKKLNDKGIKTVMLTGDDEVFAKKIAKEAGINLYYSNLLPLDKALIIDKAKKKIKKQELIAYVGDGINDSLALSKSDIGIAMGIIGQDAAISSSDILLMKDRKSVV